MDIQIADLRKAFRSVEVLRGLTAAFRRGERVALIGQNGAGKTTLIRCLLGEYAFEGSIRMFGLDPHRDRVALLQRIGYVPQHPPPLQMTVGELVGFACRLCEGLRPEDVLAVCRKLGLDLEQAAGQVFARLSGGMKQKVLIALALGRRPEVLILDEPAANLDPEGRAALFDLLQGMPTSTFMLLISHRVDELKGLIDRVMEMDQGRVIVDRGLRKSPSQAEAPSGSAFGAVVPEVQP